MTLFLNLPLELLEQIIILSSPQGAARLSQCCKQLNSIVQKDGHIWRSLYLEHWDDPRASDADEYNWRDELQKNCRAWNTTRALQTTNPPFDVPKSLREMSDDAYRHCAGILLRSRGHNATSHCDFSGSRSLTWLKRVVGEHAVHIWPWILPAKVFKSYQYPTPAETSDGTKASPGDEGTGDPNDEDGGDSAAGQLYLTELSERWRLMRRIGYPPPAITYRPDEPSTPLLYAKRTRKAARCFVYDMRRYRGETCWGPWTPVLRHQDDNVRAEGAIYGVNWEHVFSLLIVTLANIEEVTARGHFIDLEAPSGHENTAPYSAPDWNARAPGDWAGVEGTWKRVISFMDYTDLATYNFPTFHGLEDALDDTIFRDPNFEEEFRLICVTLTIESISTPGLIDPTRPTIRFRGVSRGGDEPTVRGNVSVTESGDIRWHLESTFDQEERWQSEGVQIGGQGSAFGVIGCWSPYEHEPVRDPAGPFWMWKIKM